jgi:redox-sensitive bicupin YhaK (pirin superfamily)
MADDERVARTATALEADGISVLRAANAGDAKRIVLDLVPAGAQVHNGASQTLDETGIADEIHNSGRYEPIHPRIWSMDRQTQADEIRRLTSSPDVMLGSVHAVTETGSLVAASASGSQLGPYASGAGKVILVVGTQKIVSDLDEALRRIDEYVFPLEDARAEAAYGVHSGVNKVLNHQSRVHARTHHRRLRRRGARVLVRKEQHTMAIQIDTEGREAVLVEDAHVRPVMGLDILEPLPSPRIPYRLVDPFILVHEGVVRITGEQAHLDTKHQHRGFDNLWYAISGSSSTGHSTGPGGAMERARLEPGALLKLRTGRGVWHAEGIGRDELEEGKEGTEMRGLLFWVNLARKDKGAEPSAQVLQPNDVPVRHDGDAIVRVLVGDGSPVELGTPGLVVDVELPEGGGFTSPIPSDFNAFVYLLEGDASFGANRHRANRRQIALLGPGAALAVEEATPGTRFVLMAGKPYGETPAFNGPFVD